MELILIILKSMVIGILGSIPVGPIVMLSIQRSLERGQKAGMCCALGAILSDTIFAALALFAVRITSILLESWSGIIQLFGGGIIVIVGVLMLARRKSNNSNTASLPAEKTGSFAGKAATDIGKSLAMGISNPGSFFWVLAALSALGLDDHLSVFQSSLVIAGVFLGSLLYWFVLTYAAAKGGKHFNMKKLQTINRAFGIAIIIFGLFFITKGAIGFIR